MLGSARVRSVAFAWVALCLALAADRALAQTQAPAPSAPRPADSPTASSQTGLQLSLPVSQSLQRMQEEWLQWMSAFYQGNTDRSDAALNALLGAAQQIGMKRLPDLSLAAAVRGVEMARGGNLARAQVALQAAERLDPGRPESAFAAASVERIGHSWFGALADYARGYARLGNAPALRLLWFEQLLLWGCCVLLFTSGLFIALQMATKGSALLADVLGPLRRSMPAPAAYGIAALILFWPLAVPSGVFWLALYWSILLWGYGSTSERVVLAALWLVAGGVPLLLAEQERRVALELSPPARAISNVLDRRLSGSLFNEIGVLRSALPHSTAALQFVGDLHRILGQWDFARSVYQRVLDDEPKNVPALLDLGAYYFRKSEFAKAVEYYQRAADAAPQDATAFFNLSVAYSESYQFDESRRALSQAQTLDEHRVSNWIQNAPPERVVTVDGGLDRATEIRAEFEAARREHLPSYGPLWRFSPLLVALGAGLLAGGLHLVRRRRDYAQPEFDLTLQDGKAAGVVRALVPGIAASEEGEGARAFFALLLPVALLVLPLSGTLGWRIPWGYGPSSVPSWLLAIAGLALFFGLRLRHELRSDAEAGEA
jgi:tetratricopeptide (TPR) repeat protein